MKKLSTGLCVLMAIALVAFGVVYGTWSGYREERAQVEELLTMENGMMDVLAYRAADGLNLCAVAKRHLNAEDEALKTLESISRAQQQAQSFQPEMDAQLTAALETVIAKLMAADTFAQSARDQRYLAMLQADLASLRNSEVVQAYNRAAEAFNTRLQSPLTGSFAMLLGIESCPLYQQGGV